MGEYYANGYGGRRQLYTAAEMFSNAALRGDSQVSQHSLLHTPVVTLLRWPRLAESAV